MVVSWSAGFAGDEPNQAVCQGFARFLSRLTRSDTKVPLLGSWRHTADNPGRYSVSMSVAQAVDQSRILIVDDDADLRRLIADFLQSHGFQVDTAEDTASMRLRIAARRPDLIVLDAMMPGEDGLSAARQLAAENGPPVIMLSALGSDTDRIVGLE